ncbi:MAG: cellulose biosynthesis cyclic di-GMP-binding regulatory protein BcsB, partial [Klebsiella sp.]|nr:cellulose biosynthesis cyclic di-GMP-binding regulatory protein BcsB [Klebsiella sp.]
MRGRLPDRGAEHGGGEGGSRRRALHWLPELRDRLPEKHGIIIGHPGDRVGGLTLPQTDKPLLRIVENPGNPAYKLLLIVGQNDAALRMAAWRLTRGDFALQTASMEVDPQAIPVGKPYDAPRWIATDRPV